MPTYGATDDGFVAKPQETIESEMKAGFRGNISPTLNLDSTSPLGQFVGVAGRQLRVLWEAVQALYAQRDPAQATGQGMVDIAKVTGTYRKVATKSTVTATCTFDTADTYLAGTLVCHPDGNPDLTFSNIDDVVVAAPGDVEVPMAATEAGRQFYAVAGTLTEIPTTVSGWTAVTNAADAVLGTDVESINDLSARREVELFSPGSGSVEAVRSAVVTALADAGYPYAFAVRVVENTTDAVDANGTPAHGMQVIVNVNPTLYGDVIARAIFAAKPAGISLGTAATTPPYLQEIAVTGDDGYTHIVTFAIPQLMQVFVEVEVDVVGRDYVDGSIEAALEISDANLYGTPGEDVVYDQIRKKILNVPGVVRMGDFYVDTVSPASGYVDIEVPVHKVAYVLNGNVTVSVTDIGEYP